jgi:hypothetical protein
MSDLILLQHLRKRRCKYCLFSKLAVTNFGSNNSAMLYLHCTSENNPCYTVANCPLRKFNKNNEVSSLEKNERKRQQNEKRQLKQEAKPWFQTFSP